MTEIADDRMPLVSIVTPSYNQAAFLEATIKSVLSQDYPNLEYIIIDGGSQDGSLEIIQRYEDELTYWISEPDSGQAEAINKGLNRSQGQIVAWLNSDDLYLPGATREAVEELRKHPQASMVYGDGVLIDKNGRILDYHRYRNLSTLDLLCFEVLLQPAVFIRRTALDRAGGLQAHRHLILDHDLWLRLSVQQPLVHVPRFWAAERTYPQAKTMNMASSFVTEAEILIEWAKSSQELGGLYRAHADRIEASLDVFAGRRLIDAGRYRQALKRFRSAVRQKPAVVIRYWYKVLQAFLGAIGLDWLFLTYRHLRRSLLIGDRGIEQFAEPDNQCTVKRNCAG